MFTVIGDDCVDFCLLDLVRLFAGLCVCFAVWYFGCFGAWLICAFGYVWGYCVCWF